MSSPVEQGTLEDRQDLYNSILSGLVIGIDILEEAMQVPLR